MVNKYLWLITLPMALIWGSFLNMLGYRLLSGDSLFRARSFCPHCDQTIVWYDLVPLLSYLWLGGRCRNCKQPISKLYPFIELLSAIVFPLIASSYTGGQLVLMCIIASALIITIRTDMQSMLISRYATTYLIPCMIGAAFFGLLPIDGFASSVGAASAYGLLQAIRYCYWLMTKKEGMGLGDAELLAFIGSFLGPLGWWITLMIGSLAGSVIGLAYAYHKKTLQVKMPFGPFLAGAALYIIVAHQIPFISCFIR